MKRPRFAATCHKCGAQIDPRDDAAGIWKGKSYCGKCVQALRPTIFKETSGFQGQRAGEYPHQIRRVWHPRPSQDDEG